MATNPKICDAEMQYFQFKAKQMFLLQKEDREWLQFSRQKQSQCSTCQSENSCRSKDIGIQTNGKKPSTITGRKPVVRSNMQHSQLPDELNFIKSKLEKIDLALSEMKQRSSDESHHIEKNKLKLSNENQKLSETSALNCLDVRRQQIIQNSLKASLQRLQHGATNKKMPMPPRPPNKNSGYFLPHDLQKKREASRKAYLLSLANTKLSNPAQKKPINYVNNGKQVRNIIASRPKKLVSNIKKEDKNLLKSRKKVALPKEKGVPNYLPGVQHVDKCTDQPFPIEAETGEAKDENIERAVDEILSDLIGEAAISLNTIKERKMHKSKKAEEPKVQDFETAFKEFFLTWNLQRNLFQNGNMQLKNELKENEISEENKVGQKDDAENPREEPSNRILNATEQDTRNIRTREKSEIRSFPPQTDLNTAAEMSHESNKTKFEEDLSKIPPVLPKQRARLISVNPEQRERIEQCRKEFWNYLENTSWETKGNFNPWMLADMIAETIMDNCISDVCEDLSDLPSKLIAELYDHEFIQYK